MGAMRTTGSSSLRSLVRQAAYAIPVMVVSLALCCGEGLAADDEKSAKVVSEADFSKSLVAEDPDSPNRLSGNFLVKTKDPGRPTLVFLDGEGNTVPIGNDPDAEPVGDSPAVWAEITDVPGVPRLKRVSVVVATTEETPEENRSGTLVVSPGNDADPLTITLSPSSPEAVPTKPAVRPSTVTIEVNRDWGPLNGWLGDDEDEESVTTALSGTPRPDVLEGATNLSSGSTSDQAAVKVDASGSGNARITVEDAGSPAEYKGAVPVANGEDGEPLVVETKVLSTDSIIWPILVGLIGSLFGWLLVSLYERIRRQRTLVLAAVRLEKTILDSRKCRPVRPLKPGENPPEVRLREIIKKCGWYGKAAFILPSRWKFLRDEEYEEQAAKYEKIEAGSTNLIKLDEAVQQLEGIMADVKGPSNGSSRRWTIAIEDCDLLLEPASTAGVGDPKGASELAEEIHRQTRILAVFCRLLKAYQKHPDPTRLAADDESPEQVYKVRGLQAHRTEKATKSAIYEFNKRIVEWEAEACEELVDVEFVDLSRDRTTWGIPGLPIVWPAQATLSMTQIDVSNRAGDVPGPSEVLSVEALGPLPTPEHLIGSIRRWDAVIALFIALLTVLAGVLTLYKGDPFGTTLDYVTVFSAAVVAQGLPAVFVANWDRMGLSRSVEPTLEPEDEKPAA